MHKEIKIHLYHPDLNSWSDHTVRELLKSLSKRTKRATEIDIESYIADLPVPSITRHKILSKFKEESKKTQTQYYIRKLTRKSFGLEADISACAYIIVGAIISQFIKDMLHQIDAYNKLVAHLGQSANIATLLISELVKNGVSRFTVKKHEVIERKKNTTLYITLTTPEQELGKLIDYTEKTRNEVAREIEKMIYDALKNSKE